MTAALPGDLEQKRAFSARERRPAPESPGMLRGIAALPGDFCRCRVCPGAELQGPGASLASLLPGLAGTLCHAERAPALREAQLARARRGSEGAFHCSGGRCA